MHIQINPATINAFDRLAHYGDGFFTTIAVSNGQVELLAEHLSRLMRDAKRLHIDINCYMQEIETTLIALSEKHPENVLKVLISSGLSERGYKRSDSPEPQVYIFVLPAVGIYPQWRASGIDLGIANMRIGASDAMVGMKHTNRIEQSVLKEELSDRFQDIIVLDEAGHIIETTAANLFFRQGNCWYTPELTGCGIEGVMRNYVMNLLKERSQPVQTITCNLAALDGASDLFICNSLMHIIPVNNLVDSNGQAQAFSNRQTKEIMELVEQELTKGKE